MELITLLSGPELEEAEGIREKMLLWVQVLPRANKASPQVSDNRSEWQQRFTGCSTFPSIKSNMFAALLLLCKSHTKTVQPC